MAERERPEADLPLDEWRGVYDGLAPRPVGEELASCDAGTRAAVAWMRSGWAVLEIPDVRVPGATLHALHKDDVIPPVVRVAARRQRIAHWAVAAVITVLIGGTWLLTGDRADPLENGQRAAGGAEHPVASAAPVPRVVAVGDNNIEFQSGPVRLVLVTGS